MTTVHGTMQTADGARPPNATVVVSLVDEAGRFTVGFDGDADREVVGLIRVPVNSGGVWTVDLTPTAAITSPSGSVLYRVDERTDLGSGATYYISVPGSGSYWAGDLRVTLPGAAPEQITGYVAKSGDTMSGPLVLPGDPVSGLQAATKAYVDAHSGGGGGGTPSATVVPETSYSQASTAGAVTAYSRGDHTHGTPALPTAGAIGAATTGHTHSGVYDPAGTTAAHEADTTAVHGIADTSALETITGSAAKVTTHAGATDPHGDRAYADTGDAARLAKASNLADVASVGTARTNLGLGGAAVLSVGTSAGTVAAGDDSRITGAQQRSTLTGKGAIYAATAAGVVTELPVGSTGQIPVADSTQAAGLRYRSPIEPAFPASWYGFAGVSSDPDNFNGSSSLGSGTIFATAVWVPAGVAIAELYCAVQTGGTHGTGAPNTIGLYTDAGVQVDALADTPTLWSAAGWRGGALAGGVQAAQASGRWVYLLILANDYSGIVIPYWPAGSGTAWYVTGPDGGPRRCMFNGASVLPASFDPAAYGTGTSFGPLVAFR